MPGVLAVQHRFQGGGERGVLVAGRLIDGQFQGVQVDAADFCAPARVPASQDTEVVERADVGVAGAWPGQPPRQFPARAGPDQCQTVVGVSATPES
mgnify:CR=1 FL=1